MKKFYSLVLLLMLSVSAYAQTTVFINEIHYDNAGGDTNEGVEIAGPAGTDLSGYTISLYNGNNGAVYDTLEILTGTIDDEGDGYGAVWFAIPGMQNGSPDGIALDNNGTLIQFLSYEGSFVGVGGPADEVTSSDIGVSEGSGTPEGESLQLIGTGDSYEEFTWSGPSTASAGDINAGQTFSTANPASITITSPVNGEELAPTNSVDVAFSTSNAPNATVTISVSINSGTPDVTNNASSPFTINGLSGGDAVTVTVELVDGGILDSDSVDFTLASITQVNNVSALRSGNIGEYYELTGSVQVTYVVTENSRNQKYMQDGTAGILIDDTTGFTSSILANDQFSGLKGSLSQFNGVLQIVPIETPSVSGTGAAITPEIVSLAEFTNNSENYESELIQINDLSFEVTGTFEDNTNYNVSNGSDMGLIRVQFGDEDLIGSNIPETPGFVIGLGGEFNGTYQLLPRFLSDVENATLSTNDFEATNFSIYPNPVNDGIVTITSSTNSVLEVTAFDILGKQVLNTTVSNNRLDVSELKAGLYILRIADDSAVTTKKLLVK